MNSVKRGEAVDDRHLTIQKHDVESLLFRCLDRSRSIRGLLGFELEPARQKHLANDRTHGRGIIDDQHPLRQSRANAWSKSSPVSCRSIGLANALSTVETIGQHLAGLHLGRSDKDSERTVRRSANGVEQTLPAGLRDAGIEKNHIEAFAREQFAGGGEIRGRLDLREIDRSRRLRRGLTHELPLWRYLGHHQHLE